MSREKENRMGTAPVNKLMLSMGIPMIISMMLQAVYNIVDSVFVSNMAGNGKIYVFYYRSDCWSSCKYYS